MNRIVVRWIVFSIFIAGMSLPALSQNTADNEVNTALKPVASNHLSGFNPRVTVSLGTWFGSPLAGINTFGTYIFPELNTSLNQKFSVSVGVGYISIFNRVGTGMHSLYEHSFRQYGSVYVKGNYQINKQVAVSVVAYKTFGIQPVTKKETVNPRALDMENQGMTINLNYKVNERFQINAGFSYNKRNYNPNYYRQEFYQPGNSLFFYNP